jgi:hypothetical protein
VPRINRRQQRRTDATLHLGSGWVRLFLAISSIFAFSLSAAIAYAGTFDFPPSDFEVMDADGTQVIGHGYLGGLTREQWLCDRVRRGSLQRW